MNKNIIGFVVFVICLFAMAYLNGYYFAHQDAAPAALWNGFFLGFVTAVAAIYRMRNG